jgi:hypothetical protein
MVAFLFSAPFFERLLLLVALLGLHCGLRGGGDAVRRHVASRTRDVMLPILRTRLPYRDHCGVRGTSALLASPVDEPVAML